MTWALVASASAATRPLDHGYASPVWSPDGTRIAFVKWRLVRDAVYRLGRAFGALYTMNADGSGVRLLVPESPGLGSPTWSPDGARIAFCPSCDAGTGISVVDADGTRLHAIAKEGHSPAWSPGGRRIAFVVGALDDNEG